MSTFKHFSVKAFIFDFSIILISVYFYATFSGREQPVYLPHPVIGFISVIGMVLLVPVYAMLQVKNLLQSYERFESIYEKWLKGLCKATLYPLIVLILLLTGLVIGNRSGLYSNYAIGVPFTIITIAALLLALYVTFLMFLSDQECELLTGAIHERDIKSFLNKLERPDVRTWLTVLIQPFILLWMNILVESAGSSELSSLEKLVFLLVSGYLPLRILTEFEPPFTPVNLIMGSGAIVFFVFQIIV